MCFRYCAYFMDRNSLEFIAKILANEDLLAETEPIQMDSFPALLTDNSVKFGSILLLGSLGLYWYISYVYGYWNRKGVPAPPAVPFLGNFFVISKPVPLALIDYREKYGKFFGIYRGQTPLLCVGDAKIIQRILVKDFHIFRNRPEYSRKDILAKTLTVQRDEKWKRLRSLVSKTFTASKLKKMQYLIQQCSESMLEHLKQLADSGQSFLAHDVTVKYNMDVMAKCSFGIDLKTYGELENPFITDAKTWLFSDKFYYIMTESVPKILQKKFGSWIFTSVQTERLEGLGFHLIEQRKTLNNEIKHDDLLQLLFEAGYGSQDDDREESSKFVGPKFLEEEDIVANIVQFLLAGYGTNATLLQFLFYQLAVNPDVQQKLYEEIKTVVDKGQTLDYDTLNTLPYLDAVISESLRVHPQSTVVSRVAAEEYYIPEYNHTMEKGEGVLIPLYSIQHDPDYFENPEQFNPERFMPENRGSIVPCSYLPFGVGPRNCIAMRFAFLVVKIALANIVHKFILCKTEQTTENLEIGYGLFLLSTNPIYVSVKQRT